MVRGVSPQELVADGLAHDVAESVAKRVNAALLRHDVSDPRAQVRLWQEFQAILREPALRADFAVHRTLYRIAYKARGPAHGPPPAWIPDPEEASSTNIGRLLDELRLSSYAELHRWSVDDREEFWRIMIRKLGIAFRRPPDGILDPGSDVRRPRWLPGAELNIAESCFRAEPTRPAIVFASEVDPEVRRITYGELWRRSAGVASGLEAVDVDDRARIAIYMPMTPDTVAIYLGIILTGRSVVGIADATPPPDLARRLQISGAEMIFTIDSYTRGGKRLRIYDNVVEAKGPPAVVLSEDGGAPGAILKRDSDRPWEDFLGQRHEYEPVPRQPGDLTNILFSSGTTKDPKGIPWTHTTPIKCAADAYLHGDARETDVLSWPTSFGWMMGPYLTYASLVNRATMALYIGDPQRREFGEFVSRAGVTFLGVVPKLVRAWKARRTMEGLDWNTIRMFGNTAEPSVPEEMFYLMWLAGIKPVIEYCGGTEVGGGYITGTLLHPCAPSTFTTPALGIDFLIADEEQPADQGEVFLIPPSIGLSNELLNYDHEREYFAGVPSGPSGEILRRHGDRIARLGDGYYRHLGRVDDVINIGGVKTSSEELRTTIWNDAVYDSKPIAVDVDGTGQHALIVYAVPKDPANIGSPSFRDDLRQQFQEAIKKRLNPLLAHVHDVVLVSELPQAGPGKTRTMAQLRRDYLARSDYGRRRGRENVA